MEYGWRCRLRLGITRARPSSARGRTGARTAGAVGAALAGAILTGSCIDYTNVVTPEELRTGGPGATLESVRVGTADRTFIVHEPPAGVGGPAPVLFLFHGAGGTGGGFRGMVDIEDHSDAAGFIVVYPDGFDNGWAPRCNCTANDGIGVDDGAFFDAMVAHLSTTRSIDVSAIFVGGFSQGALLSAHLACREGARVAGMAGVGATMAYVHFVSCRHERPLAVILFEGTSDPVFPWNGVTGSLLSMEETAAEWAEANACQPEPEVQAVPDDFDDGTTVERLDFVGCDPLGPVRWFAIAGGGHTWPGMTARFPSRYGATSFDVSASREIVDFFGAFLDVPSAGRVP